MLGNDDGIGLYDCLHVKWKYGYEIEYFWLSGVVLSFVGVIGLLGNIIILVVLWKPRMRKNVFYNLLFSLSCFDILFIISYGVSVAYKSLACYPFNRIVGSVAYPLLNIGISGSIYMTVAISIERYLGICYLNCNYRRKAWVFIAPVFLLTLTYNIPKLIERKFNFSNGTLIAESESFRNDETYNYVYNLWGDILFNTVLPLIALLFFNGSIMVRMKKTSKTIIQLGNSYNRKGTGRITTKILFWIVLIFLILHSPRVAYKLLFYLGPEDKTTWYWVRPVARLALITNSSANFLIYCLVGKNFRTELVKVLCPWKATALNSNYSRNTSSTSTLKRGQEITFTHLNVQQTRF